MSLKLILLLLCFTKVVVGSEKTASIFPKTDAHIVNHIYYLLDVLDHELSSHNIPYWISCGTLLGAVRHGGMIPWDDDGDIFVFVDFRENLWKIKDVFLKYGTLLAKPTKKCGYQPMTEKDKNDNIYRLIVKGDTVPPCVDIFFVSMNASDYKIRPLWNSFANHYWNQEEIASLIRIPFGPLHLYAPSKGVQKHLHRVYGDDCLEKGKFWNHHRGRMNESATIIDFSPALPNY